MGNLPPCTCSILRFTVSGNPKQIPLFLSSGDSKQTPPVCYYFLIKNASNRPRLFLASGDPTVSVKRGSKTDPLVSAKRGLKTDPPFATTSYSKQLKTDPGSCSLATNVHAPHPCAGGAAASPALASATWTISAERPTHATLPSRRNFASTLEL